MSSDDHTLVGDQGWQDLGGQELPVPPLPIAQAMPILLDPQTARAVRAVCWPICVAIWLFNIVALVVLAGLFVGAVNGTPPVP